MLDTHFVVPAGKLRQKAALYDCKRALRPAKRAANGNKPYYANRWHSHQMDLGLFSGGGGILSYADAGIYSTAEDYARFCQMLISEGVAASGRRVLQKRTVRKVWQDCLAPFARKNGS